MQEYQAQDRDEEDHPQDREEDFHEAQDHDKAQDRQEAQMTDGKRPLSATLNRI